MHHVDHIRVTELFAFDASSNVRMTPDGYLTATPRVGRIGIQLYRGSELGRPEQEVVRVWRPEAEVMHKDAMRTIAHRPITNNHPGEAVTADNWKKYAAGQTGDTVARDGEFIRVPMVLMDGGTIKDVNDGKKELSLGYTSNIEWRKGVTDNGEEYDAVQTQIRVNHLAVVDAARGGPKLSIGDSVSLDQPVVDQAKKWIADGKFNRKDLFGHQEGDKLSWLVQANDTYKYPFAKDGKVYRSALVSIKAEAETSQHSSIVAAADELLKLIDTTRVKTMNDVTQKLTTINLDGIPVEMSDIAASVVLRRVKGLEAEAGDLRTKLEEEGKKAKSKDEMSEEEKKKMKKKHEEDAATIATLQQQLKDAAITPEKLDKLVADRSVVIGKAKVILGDKLVITGKTEADMRRQVVDAKMGDGAKGWSDDAIIASFATLTNDVKPEQIRAADAAAAALSGSPPSNLSDREKPYTNYDARLQNAWKGEQPTKQ